MNIQTISLRDVIVSGCHGATVPERENAQAFSVDLEMTFDAGPAITSDQLKDTVDYYDIIKVIKDRIEKASPHVLLETLVNETSKDVAEAFPCNTLELSIRKSQVPFQPSIGIKRAYFSQRGKSPAVSFEDIHQKLINEGAASVPFLSDEEVGVLLAEACTLEFIRQPEMTEGGIVREDLFHCPILSEGSRSFAIADRISLFMSELASATGQTFTSGLPKPDVRMQKYDAGSFGITPHRDEKKYRYAIFLIPLVGKGALALCDDRQGSNPRILDTTPGNLVILRAPGYANLSVRPMHTISDITEERIVFGVRFAV